MANHKSTIPKTFASFLQMKSASEEISYIGPRAIFNPNFLPTKIIPRFKKAEIVHGIIQDAIEDDYATNLTLYGLQGAGKNLIFNVLFEWFELQQSTENEKNTAPYILSIDCTDQELGQILFSILNRFCKLMEISIRLDEVLTWDTITLWNTFKYLVSKCERPIFLYLRKIEYVEEAIIDKFLNFAKSTTNLHILTSIDTGNQTYAFNQYNQLDHRIKLGILNTNELVQIARQRSLMAFKTYLEPDVLKLIVDYIVEYGTKVPGSCINVLKRIYPLAEEQGEIMAEDIRKLIQYYFEGVSIDSLAIADYVMKTSIEERLFLDYLVNHFRNPSQFYISNQEIEKAYMMTAEELGFQVHSIEYKNRFEKIADAQILRPSCFSTKLNHENKKKSLNSFPSHYLSLPLEEMNQLLDMSFGMINDLF